ncbi:hypothetical protein IAU60_006529 [Kwoniella sp. DSM 27419]
MGVTAEPKELGTLIVVVGKARNLVNKSRFGKQDPFCTVAFAEEKHKTKAIKRGGQHPEWDEELRFTVMEDLDDVLVRSESQSDSLNSSLNGAPAPLPKDTPAGVITSAALASMSRKGKGGKKGGKSLKVACYADDAKEPELIGECLVPIDEVLKKGEVDEWYEFLYKEKYSGEIYLELTFYSNNAPPVRRHVPRPAIYDSNSLASLNAVNASPSGSLSTRPSRNTLSGLASSTSISGMPLYIPPYVQQNQPSVSAVVPQAMPPAMPSSNTFANLGLPPGHQSQTVRPPYQASSHSSVSIDSLTRPMSSMSLGQSYNPSPLPPTPAPGPSYVPPFQQPGPSHAHGLHRHSVSGGQEAPWAPIISQSQAAAAPTPHPRPMSTSDAIPWEQAHRLEQDRLTVRASATPLPRPTSGQSYGAATQTQQQHPHPRHRQSFSGSDHRVPSPIPESLRPGPPPGQDHQHPSRSHSFSPAGSSVGPAYPTHSPAPVPPAHSASAPPGMAPTASYPIPSSSFGNLTRPVADPHRAPSPGPGYHSPNDQRVGGYDAHPQQPHHHGQQPAYQTPTRRDTYPPQPSGWDYQTPPPAQSYSPAYPQAQPVYTPPPPPSSSSAPPSNGGYVPWYQQTQSAVQAQSLAHPLPQPSHDSPYSDHQGPPPDRYQTPLPPPVPQSRPQPVAPPPRPVSVGYYPSDELYARQSTPQPTAPPPGQASWQSPHSQPPHDQHYAYDPQRPQMFSPAAPNTCAPTPPHGQHMAAPPPPQLPHWQQPEPYPPNPSRTPVPQEQWGGHPAQPTYDHYQQSSQRAPSPQPPQNPYGRAASPQPQGQSYQLPYPVQGQQEPWQATAQPMNQLAPPQGGVPPAAGRTPSPGPNPTAKTNWRAYMAGLSTTPNGGIQPARTPSPQPPPKDEPQGQWYTPPPSLPTSLAPPEGWQSTLPAQRNGHQWSG